MISLLRKVLPAPVKRIIRALIKKVKYTYRYFVMKRVASRGEDIRIIVGAAETFQGGWYSTNEQWLDITKKADWLNVFGEKKQVTHIVAEHVFEHLTHAECKNTLTHMAAHMSKGARVRIAVPDGYNPSDEYIRHVGINGIGDDASDHKQLLNSDVLSDLLRDSGFDPILVEGYDSKKTLIQTEFSMDDGYIMRSRAHGVNDNQFVVDFPDSHTSLIVDGIKNA